MNHCNCNFSLTPWDSLAEPFWVPINPRPINGIFVVPLSPCPQFVWGLYQAQILILVHVEDNPPHDQDCYWLILSLRSLINSFLLAPTIVGRSKGFCKIIMIFSSSERFLNSHKYTFSISLTILGICSLILVFHLSNGRYDQIRNLHFLHLTLQSHETRGKKRPSSWENGKGNIKLKVIIFLLKDEKLIMNNLLV